MNRRSYEKLEVIGIDVSQRELSIEWECEGIGWGEYAIRDCGDDGIELASECMDSKKDKEFLKTLLGALFDYLDKHAEVVE